MTQMLEDIKKSVCANYSFDEIGINEYLVHTDMYYDDGDELHIVMKINPTGIMLTDEGHTLMWLSYEEFNFTDTRTKLLNKFIDQNNVTLSDGRIQVEVDAPEHVGSALSSLIQVMLQVACLRNFSRSNVVNSFMEDVLSTFRNSDLAGRCEYRKKIPANNGDVIEPDIFISQKERPVLLFIAGGPERAKEVVINLFLVQNLNKGYRTVVVIDDNSGISKKDRERLVNGAERPIIGTESVLPLTESLVKV